MTTEPFDKSARRIEFLYQWVLALAVLLFFIVPSFVLYQWATGPVRELKDVPGVTMVHVGRGEPHVRFEVDQIEFRETVVTADVLRPALEFPFLTVAFFDSCRIDPDAGAVLAKCRTLQAATFVDCQMDVAKFVSQCKESGSIRCLCLFGTTVRPGDFRDIKDWNCLETVRLRESDIEGDDIRDIVKAKHIRELFLYRTTLSDDEIDALVEADVFRTIVLDDTDLTLPQLAKLCQCTKLERLLIEGTQIPESAVEFLAESPSLKRVGASRTPLGEGFMEKQLANGCIVSGSGENQMPRNP